MLNYHVVLCPPDFYNIEYEINPWMHIENNVSGKTVLKQYEELKNTYRKLGIKFYEIKPTKGLPDQVYITNAGHPEGNIFIKANFRYTQRRPEAAIAAALFEEKGYEIKTIPEDIFFEGQGDLLKVGNKYFMGWGYRTSQEAKKYLERILQTDITDLHLIDPYFYHLDTSLALLSEDLAIINPKAYTPESLDKLEREFKNIIRVTNGDNNKLACNMVIIDKNVVVNEISEGLKQQIESYGFTVHTVQMSEYIKGGGSVKCVSLQIF